MNLQQCVLTATVVCLIAVVLATLARAIANLLFTEFQTVIQPFTRFGILFTSPRKPAIYYVDEEWLLLDHSPVNSIESLRSSEHPPLLGDDDDHRPADGCLQHNDDFADTFPYFLYKTVKTRYSLGTDLNDGSSGGILLVGSEALSVVIVAHICYVGTRPDPVVIRESLLRDENGNVFHLPAVKHLQMWRQQRYDKDREELMITFVTNTTGEDGNAPQGVLVVGVLVNGDDFQDPSCPPGDLIFSEVNLRVVSTFWLGNCNGSVSLSVKRAYKDISPDWVSLDSGIFHLELFVVCGNFIRVVRIKANYDSTDPVAYCPPNSDKRCSIGQPLLTNSTLQKDAAFMDIANGYDNSHVVFWFVNNQTDGKEASVDSYIISNISRAGVPYLAACVNPNKELIWALQVDILRTSSCQTVYLNRSNIITSFNMAPDGHTLVASLQRQGVVYWRLPVGGTPELDGIDFRSLNTVRDGLVGSFELTWQSLAHIIFDKRYPHIYYTIDDEDGLIRWSAVSSMDSSTWDTLHSRETLYVPAVHEDYIINSSLVGSPHWISRSSRGPVVVGDSLSRTINLLQRFNSDCSLRLTPLIHTESPPGPIEANLGDYIVWTEGHRKAIAYARWDDILNGKPEVKDAARGRSIDDLAYSPFYDRLYMTCSTRGEILSLKADIAAADLQSSLIKHFDSSHFDSPGSWLKILKPSTLAIDEGSGTVFFTTLPTPNLSAYDLPGTIEEQEAQYLSPGIHGIRRLPDGLLRLDGGAQDLASTIWALQKRPFSSSLKYPPTPYFTDRTTIITAVRIAGEWLVFAEKPLSPQANLTGRIRRVRISAGSLTIISEALESKDAIQVLPWTQYEPMSVFAPIGALNIWASSGQNVSVNVVNGFRGDISIIYGWIAIALLMSNIVCAITYNGCKRLQLADRAWLWKAVSDNEE